MGYGFGGFGGFGGGYCEEPVERGFKGCNSFALIVVLFILLIIVGATFYC